jgi:hypothetical protein
MRHGVLRFMRAHGQTPGPGQRPRLTGAVAGTLGGIAAVPILDWSRAIPSLGAALGLDAWVIVALSLALCAVAGAVYGAVFQRAAGDPRGGWLFGLSYGFLLWMLGPIALLQTILRRPLATGIAAMGLLGASLVSGLVLGVLFRPVHRLVGRRFDLRWSDRLREGPSPERPPAVALPHTLEHHR